MTIVAEFTEFRTSSLRDLTNEELSRLERRIEMINADPSRASAQRMRRKVIAILATRGAVKEGKPDMEHINAWFVRYGHLHKPLNEYPLPALQALVTQAEAVMVSDLNAIKNHG